METKIQSEAFQTFIDVSGSLMNYEIQTWLDKGGKVAGHFCSTVPEEIIMAAGYMPFRMRGTGSTDTELADAYFSPINCSFPRHVMNQALKGEFKFLDALLCINACDHVRRIYDNWVRYAKDINETTFETVMSLPRKCGERQVDWYYDEINILRDQLAKHTGVEITDDKIREAIKLNNQARSVQKELYELRKADNPPITGAETLVAIVAGTAMPKERYIELMRQLIDDLKDAEGNTGYKARIMIVGGELDDPEYVNVIEDQGGLVVTDSNCFGSRLFWVNVDEEVKDPVRALARYYIYERPTCPRTYGSQPERMKFTRDLAKEFNVDGIIGERLLYCDSWLVEHYMTKFDLKEHNVGVPFLALDREYVLSGKGQIKTRVQAFLETMES